MTGGNDGLYSSGVLPIGVGDLEAEDAEAVARVVRFAANTASAADLLFLSRAAKTWMDSDGAVPLERCMRLPTTPKAFRCMQRDMWLCDAARHVPQAAPWAASTHLAEEWECFLSRGPWREWRDDATPPADASVMHQALFYASKFNRGNSIGVRHLHRIVRRVLEAKSRKVINSL